LTATWVISLVVDDVLVVVVIVVVMERAAAFELFVVDIDLYVRVSRVVTVVLMDIEATCAAVAPNIAKLFSEASVTSFTSTLNVFEHS
jgi:hypothetical protein